MAPSLMKKLVCFILLFIMLFAVTTVAYADEAEAEDFHPVMRFVLASDTHILTEDKKNDERIRSMMELAYRVAEGDEDYDKIDALIIAGDLTDDGTTEEFDRFQKAVSESLRDDTVFYGVVAKNHDGYALERTEVRDYYKQITGNDADFSTVIGGYHFIGVSASPKKSKHYDSDQLKWLEEQLDAAVAENPDKPVFVIHHEPSRNTVYGSSTFDGWGIGTFKALLKKYPQAVELAGHSHYPINNPRSVWQGEYTAVGTGAIYYSEFTVGAIRAYHPDDSEDTGTCRIVELDGNGNMRLRGYDVVAQKQLCEEYLANPAKVENRAFTPEKRKAAAKAPSFEESAVLSVRAEYGKCTVTVPEAKSNDGMPVTLYRATAKKVGGIVSESGWKMPVYYRAVDDRSAEIELEGLPDGEYTVSVIAENAYGDKSAPITATVKVEGDKGIKVFFMRVKLLFKDIKFFFRQLFW